jgi:hypothetical protein
MYEAQLEKDWKYVITDSDTKLILCANDSIYNVVKDYVGKVCLHMYIMRLIMNIYICIYLYTYVYIFIHIDVSIYSCGYI